MDGEKSPREHYFDLHVFCCVNERPPEKPRGSCKARGGADLRDYMKKRGKALGIKNIRINSAGCLDRCELGPCLVIYPEQVWYFYETRADVDEILQSHVIEGKRVERLILDADQSLPKPRDLVDLTLTLASVEDLTPAVKRFSLVAADGGDLPSFTAGAHVDVDTGGGRRRSYSLANHPDDRGVYEIAVLREEGGDGGSLWMHRDLNAGDTLTVREPQNDFPINHAARRSIMIAGGIGITPLLSMARHHDTAGADFHLHYCAKSADDAAFHDDIRDAFDGRVTFHFDGGDPAKGISIATVLGAREDGDHLYVCGPVGLIDAAIATSNDCNWPDGTVHYELFAARTDPEAVNEAFTVELSLSGKTLSVPADKSILEVVRAAGVEVDSACESGTCGTCWTTLTGGAADHRDEVMDDAEKSENKAIMICVSRAKEGETLVLDL